MLCFSMYLKRLRSIASAGPGSRGFAATLAHLGGGRNDHGPAAAPGNGRAVRGVYLGPRLPWNLLYPPAGRPWHSPASKNGYRGQAERCGEAGMRDARILIYSHDTFGLGHLRRCRAIAHALVQEDKEL